jgi:hypothetical protein
MKKDRSEYMKNYQEKNKDKIKAQRDANKEEKKANYEANKEEILAKGKVNYESKKDGYYTVYYLKEEHYAGMTTNLSYRLIRHKSRHNRHIEDVEIIGKYKTKAEAARVEAALHAMGYLGRNSNYKPQTLNQLLLRQWKN